MSQFLAVEKNKLAEIGTKQYPEYFKVPQYLTFLLETIEKSGSPSEKAEEIESRLKKAELKIPYLWAECLHQSTLPESLFKPTPYRSRQRSV